MLADFVSWGRLTMIYVINNSNDPFFNHAAEEYLMNNFDNEVFMLWVNKPSILIGRNQNTISEINLDYVKESDIAVVRRLSGGGTVYNDFGNINFTFITYRDLGVKNGFEKFALPIVEALRSLGIDAQFTGRNDITIEGKKVSGNAQYYKRDKLLHHGTLLYNADITKLSLALKSKSIKFVDKSVKSVNSRVTNIAKYMKESMDLLVFKEYLKAYVMKTYNIETVYEFSDKDLKEIHRIAKNRFETWEWNYGKSPNYKYLNSVKYPSGVIEYYLDVENGKISNVSIYGDFFGEKNIAELEERLLGVKYNMKDLQDRLQNVNIDEYILGISVEEFIKGLLGVK